MKKFKKIKTLETSKLTKEQMYQVKGGLDITVGSRSVCHIDVTNEIEYEP